MNPSVMDIIQIANLTKPTGAARDEGATVGTENAGAIGCLEASGPMLAKKATEKGGKEEKGKKLGPPEPGFQAVILCGPGTSLYPFTGEEELLPKALIPIANKPMIQYSLEWCQKARFESILIITLSEHLAQIQAYVNSQTLPFSIQIEGPSALDENLGTADVLRRAYRKGWVTGDIVVLPCDLITDLDPEELVRIWMVENAGFDSDMGKRNIDTINCREDDERRGGLGIWYDVRGEGQVKGQETDFLALAPHREPSVGSTPESQFSGALKSLLYNLPGQELTNKEGYPFRKSFTRKCPDVEVNSNVRDSGIYFLPFWILRFINKNPKMNSIREDVLPWWSKARWQNRRLARKLGLLDILSEGGDTFEQRLNLAEMSSTRKRDIVQWTQQDSDLQRVYSELDLGVLEKLKNGVAVSKKPLTPESSTRKAPPPPPPPPPPGGIKIPPMIAYLPERSRNFTRRVDTVHLYHSMCLYIASPAFKSDQIRINPSASIDRTAKINKEDCLIAGKVSIAGKSFIKSSVLGFGVSIGNGAKVMGSVLMDGASVAEGSRVEGCILGKNVIVGAGAKLKNCKVAPGLFVEPGSENIGEIMTAFDGIHNNISSQPGSDSGDDFQHVIKDPYDQGRSELDEFFGDTKPERTMDEKSGTRGCINNHENSEDEDGEDIGDNGIEDNDGIKDNDGIEGNEDIEHHEVIKHIEDIGNTENTGDGENIGDTDGGGEINGYKQGEDQKVEGGQKNSGTQIDKVEVAIKKPVDDDSIEDKGIGQGHLNDLKTETIQTEQKPDEKETVPEPDHNLDKALPVRRDSSETEALYKEAVTNQDITNASPSPKIDQSDDVDCIQTVSKTASSIPAPSMSKKASALVWGTWGLGILTLGVWIAFF